MENVRIELYLGEGATGAQCTISSAGSGVGSVGGIEGSWTFDPRRAVRMFPFHAPDARFDPRSRSSAGTFQTCTRPAVGCFVVLGPPSTFVPLSSLDAPLIVFFRAAIPRPAHAFQIYFEVPSYSFSSLKVDQVRLSSETYKMYKGVRTTSCGSIEWRW
jgi:AP-3 complex subunit mu